MAESRRMLGKIDAGLKEGLEVRNKRAAQTL
jgi:hypothetical protein